MDIDEVENVLVPVEFNTSNLGLESEELEELTMILNTLNFKDVSGIGFITILIMAQTWLLVLLF